MPIAPIIPAIVGPTASGKSALARELADRTSGRLVSVDSRKIYRRLNIGTAKPSPELAARYDYVMIDLVEPMQPYSAYQYAQSALEVIKQTLTAGRLPILVGGTGLYLRALKDGLFEGPGTDEAIRERIRRDAGAIGWDLMFERLKGIDPEAAARIGPQNIPRIERALEVYYLTGESITSWQKAGPYCRPPWQFVLFGIDRLRADLYRRIDLRVERMVELGLFEEVEALLASGVAPDSPGLRTVGYVEVIECLQGRLLRSEAVERIKLNTRRYAKRQMTWFTRQEKVSWLQPDMGPIDRILSMLGGESEVLP